MDISFTSEQVKLTTEQFNELQTIVNTIVKQAGTIAVMELEDVSTANTVMKNIAKKTKELEGFRKIFTQKLDAKKAEIMDQFKKLSTPLENEVTRLKNDLLTFEKRIREKEEAERRARAEEERQKALLNGIADAEYIEVQEVLPKKSSLTGVTTTNRKTWEVTDLNIVPREYLMIDEKKINLTRAQYEVEDPSPIPGIKFTKTLSVRA